MIITHLCIPQEALHEALKPNHLSTHCFLDIKNANIAGGSFSRYRSTRHDFSLYKNALWLSLKAVLSY